MSEFMSPYAVQKILSGVIPANKPVRANFLQSFFGTVRTSDSKTVNFDVEFGAKNTVAVYARPDTEVTPITLPGYGHKELSFAYVKEDLTSPDYEEIETRALGDDFGIVDPAANEIANIQAKLAIAEQRIENLFELNAANIIVNGTHSAVSEYHPEVYYDFGRKVVTTDAEFQTGYVPYVDLTTLNSNGNVGKKAWKSTGGTVAPTPLKDLRTMIATAKRRAGTSVVVMAANAYEALEDDINANYKDAANLNYVVASRLELKILPTVNNYEGVTYQRSLNLGGSIVDIYTYEGTYDDRKTGVATKFYPSGYVSCLPDPSYGIQVYGRILHRRAEYRAMKRYINVWEENRTGKIGMEVQLNYLMGHRDIDSVVTWKVM